MPNGWGEYKTKDQLIYEAWLRYGQPYGFSRGEYGELYSAWFAGDTEVQTAVLEKGGLGFETIETPREYGLPKERQPVLEQKGQYYGQTSGWAAIQPIIKEARELGFDTSYLESLQYHPMNTESDVRAVTGSAQASGYQMSEAIRTTKARQTIPEMQWLSQAYPEEMKAMRAKVGNQEDETEMAFYLARLPEYQKLLGKQKATQKMQQLQFEENVREAQKPRIAEQTARFRPPTRWLNY